jgi:hypothetical protein
MIAGRRGCERQREEANVTAARVDTVHFDAPTSVQVALVEDSPARSLVGHLQHVGDGLISCTDARLCR